MAIFIAPASKARYNVAIAMHSHDPATAAFIRYLRQELGVLSGPIEAGCQHLAECGGSTAPEILRMTLRSIAAYFVRMSGAMTQPTTAFWSDVADFLESEFGAFPISEAQDREFFRHALKANIPSQSFGPGMVDLRALHAVDFYDCTNNSSHFRRAKMFLWRFAAAFVAADLEGTIDEETALDEFKKVLDADPGADPGDEQPAE